MSEPRICPKCGVRLSDDAPAGLCPRCLVQAGFESEDRDGPQPERTTPSPGSSGFESPSVEELAARFPQLELLELLGKGGMGAVFKARQPELDRLVAVKILPPEISRDPAFAERFAREARALAKLSHANIVAVHDFGRTDDGLFYFVMEYVDGVNLREAIQASGMSPKEALAIVPQICDALQFAHDEGIVHRDIKPENILLDKRGRVKIADFGLAKLLGHASGDVSLTGEQQVMGTLRYMAPEQMEGSKAVDHRADIYSLGVVFYELLTGELPIGRFAPPSKKVEIDVRLDEVVLRALEKEPERRYQHVSEVKTEVEAIRGSAPAVPRDPVAKAPDELVRKRLTVITLILVTLAVAAFLGLQAGYLAEAEWYFKEELPYDYLSLAFLGLFAMSGFFLCYWWYLLAKDPNTERSLADFFRVLQGPHPRVKRLWLPLGLFLGAYAVAMAVGMIAFDDTVQTVVMTIPHVVAPYFLMAVLWRIYRPAAGPPTTQGKPIARRPVSAGRSAVWRLGVRLAVWTAIVVVGWIFLMVATALCLPHCGLEVHERTLRPQSGAYPDLRLRATRNLWRWGGTDRLIAKGAWTATAKIDLPGTNDSAILEFDPFRERWSWGRSPVLHRLRRIEREISPQDVVQWFKDAGVDTSRSGVQEEAAELIRLLKDAATGVQPQGGHFAFPPAGPAVETEIGLFTDVPPRRSGGEGSWPPRWLVLSVDVLSLVVWGYGVLILVRRHRRRLDAAPKGEPVRGHAPGASTGARAEGAIRRTFAQWWSERGRWFANSVKAVLLLACLLSLLTFFSFRSIWTPKAVRSEVGRPSPWLTAEKVEKYDPTGAKHAARGGMKIIFASVAWVFLGAGFLAYYAYWRIRKVEAGTVSKWESPLVVAWLCAVWAIVAMVCALWPIFTSPSAAPSGRHDLALLHVVMMAAIVGFLAWLLWFWRKLPGERRGGPGESPVPSPGASQVDSIGRISLWTSIAGSVLPVLLALGVLLLAELLHLTEEGYLIVCLVLGIVLEVAALGCGIVGWRSKSGKAGLIISVLSLVLFALVFWVLAPGVPVFREPGTPVETGGQLFPEPIPEPVLDRPVLPTPDAEGWMVLFNGKHLANWSRFEGLTNIQSSDEFRIEDGYVQLPASTKWSVLKYRGPFPTANYEVEFDAQQTTGDLLCHVGLPVGTGLALLTLRDNLASALITRNILYEPDEPVTLDANKWRKVQIRVADRVEVTVDGVKVFNPIVKGNNFDPPKDCETLGTFSLMASQSEVRLRNIRLRSLPQP